MSSLQQNWRKEQNRFCLEARGVRGRGRRQGAGCRNGPNNVCIYEYMNQKKRKGDFIVLAIQLIHGYLLCA
jgi:ribosomal protein L20